MSSIVYFLLISNGLLICATPFSDFFEQKTSKVICTGKKDGTLIADLEDHSKFYECNNGLPFLFQCPDGLLFDPVKQACNFDPKGPTKRPPYNGNSTFNCSGKVDGFYADEKDQTKFHECVNGYPWDFQCPPTTKFDLDKKACLYDLNKKSTTFPTTKRFSRETKPTTIASTTVISPINITTTTVSIV